MPDTIWEQPAEPEMSLAIAVELSISALTLALRIVRNTKMAEADKYVSIVKLRQARNMMCDAHEGLRSKDEFAGFLGSSQVWVKND